MALLSPMLFRCSTLCLRERPLLTNTHTNFSSKTKQYPLLNKKARLQKLTAQAQQQSNSSDSDDSDNDSDPYLMSKVEREEMRRKIRDMLDKTEVPQEETDPEQRKIKMQELLAEYPLVVEEEDQNWTEDADGWGFSFDQFFNKISIKNVKKESDEDNDNDNDSDNEIVWQDDDYIKPIRDITAKDWEDTVFRDFNPLVILVHNRYKRPRENEKARMELERAVNMFWDTGMPSPRVRYCRHFFNIVKSTDLMGFCVLENIG